MILSQPSISKTWYCFISVRPAISCTKPLVISREKKHLLPAVLVFNGNYQLFPLCRKNICKQLKCCALHLRLRHLATKWYYTTLLLEISFKIQCIVQCTVYSFFFLNKIRSASLLFSSGCYQELLLSTKYFTDHSIFFALLDVVNLVLIQDLFCFSSVGKSLSWLWESASSG